MRCVGRSGKALAAGVSATLALASLQARGQTQPRGDKVAAEALFQEGRKLMAAGQYAQACPKFAGSEQLDPSAATLLNLASCLEKTGHAATAWATYRQAASVANAVGRAEYVTIAQRHADRLEPLLAHLTLNVAQPVPGIEIQRDDAIVPAAAWGTAIPIDSGSHSLAATAPEHAPWAATVDVPTDGAAVVFTVPPLDPLPVAAPVPPPIAPATASAPTAATLGPASAPPSPEATSPVPRGVGQRVSGWVLGSVGIASVATGAVFAALAEAKYKSSLNDCVTTNSCDPTGLSERNQARTDGDVASWTIGVGAAAAAAGLVLLLTAPRGRKLDANHPTVALAPMPTGAALTGSW